MGEKVTVVGAKNTSKYIFKNDYPFSNRIRSLTFNKFNLIQKKIK